MFKKFKKHVHNRCSSHLTYFLVASVLVAIAVVVCLSTRVFETRTATGSELFSLLTCPHRTPFTLLRIFSPSEMSVIKNLGDDTVPAREMFFKWPSASQTRACLRFLLISKVITLSARGIGVEVSRSDLANTHNISQSP